MLNYTNMSSKNSQTIAVSFKNSFQTFNIFRHLSLKVDMLGQGTFSLSGIRQAEPVDI